MARLKGTKQNAKNFCGEEASIEKVVEKLMKF